MKALALVSGISGLVVGALSFVSFLMTAGDMWTGLTVYGEASVIGILLFSLITSLATSIFFVLIGVFFIRLSKRFEKGGAA